MRKRVNANEIHAQERQSLNDRIAVILTRVVGSMWCAYVFVILACFGFPGSNATSMQLVQWISQTLIQLVMLSVIMVGQNVLHRKSEIQADTQFADIEHISARLDAQDILLKKMAARLEVDGCQ